MKPVILFPVRVMVLLIGLVALFGSKFCDEVIEQCVIALRLIAKK